LIGELKGSTAVTVMSGDVELACVSGGTVHVRSLAGDVRVGIREGLDVWLDLSSIGGDVRSALETGRTAPGGEPTVELTVVTTSGDIDVRRANRVGA
jgi:predicted membrane protein